ncbi:hypothetical protein DFH06DRAFT_481534 [Mycena polygramma]|nr:hypothetical protein DFH06DRAFT_481534 [Mycena polygramma]
MVKRTRGPFVQLGSTWRGFWKQRKHVPPMASRGLPPELVHLIVYQAWDCLSTSSHRHAHSMTQWMLVSHDWLDIVLYIVFRDVWITSRWHKDYIEHICSTNKSYACGLAGITDVRQHLVQTCRSLTISVYHSYQEEYAAQCKDLLAYAATDPHAGPLLPWNFNCYGTMEFAVGTQSISRIISDFTPRITALHYVLIDCNATYGAWDFGPRHYWYYGWPEWPPSLVDLHVTFVYTTPPPALLQTAPRGTFFPPTDYFDLPMHECRFNTVRRLVVRDANADFVAFLTQGCPLLERIETTAGFAAEDVPEDISADVKDRLVFVRLPRSTKWPGVTSGDTRPILKHWPRTTAEWLAVWAPWVPSDPDAPSKVSVQKRRKPFWHSVTRGFWRRN